MPKFEFLAGTVHPNTQHRYICAGKATPNLEELTYIVDQVPASICDWGQEAEPEALNMLVNLILQHYNIPLNQYSIAAQRLRARFQRELKTGKMWILPKTDLEKWILDGDVN